MTFACPECSHRQEAGDRCGKCNYDGLLDLSKLRNRELLRDIDRRAEDKHDDRVRKLSVAIAMGGIIACWFIPGFWSMRMQAFALPLLLDQWLLMLGLAMLIMKVWERYPPKKKFPWVDDYKGDEGL